MTCPNCGRPTVQGAKFCGFCGTRLTQPAQTPPNVNADDSPDAPTSSDEPRQSPSIAPEERPTSEEAPISAPQTDAEPMASAPQVQQPAQTQPAQPAQLILQPLAQAQPTPQPAQSIPQVQQPAQQPQPQPAQAQPAQPTPQTPPAQQPSPFQQPNQIRPTANPTVAALTTPNAMRTMGISLGIGLAAAAVMALLGSVIFLAAGSTLSSDLSDTPLSDFTSLMDGSGASYTTPNIFQVFVSILVLGISGSFSLKTSSSGFSLSDLGVNVSTHTGMSIPVALPGIALMLGAAFGAYMLARRFALRFKWTGAISAGLVGVLSGLIMVVLASVFPLTVGGSYGSYSASASLSGASFRTFFMAFLLTGAGALAGYALAQYACDADNVFSAAWRWAHRTRGFVRTLVEAITVYLALFSVIGLILLAILSVGEENGIVGFLLLPLLFPVLPFMLCSLASFGGLSMFMTGGTHATFTLFSSSSDADANGPLWFCFALFLIATCYLAFRETARNMYDPYYAKWEHTWKAPVAMMAFWLVAEAVFTPFTAEYGTYRVSITVPTWYFLVAGIWMFLIEVIAMTFGPTLVSAVPGLWKLFVGGTVRPTPQNVVEYVRACEPKTNVRVPFGAGRTAPGGASAAGAAMPQAEQGFAAGTNAAAQSAGNAPQYAQPHGGVPQPQSNNTWPQSDASATDALARDSQPTQAIPTHDAPVAAQSVQPASQQPTEQPAQDPPEQQAVEQSTQIMSVQQPTQTMPTQTMPTQVMPAPQVQPVAPLTQPTTPIARPATPAASAAPDAQPAPFIPPTPAPGEGKSLDPKTKKTILIGGIVIGALIVLGIVYGALNATVFSAKSVAQNYLTAISDGDYAKAGEIADPQVNTQQRKLLSNAIAKADNATISNPQVTDVRSAGGQSTVTVSYSINGKTVEDSLTISKSGSQFVIFPNWKIMTPLLKSITISTSDTIDSLNVNGVDVSAKNAEKVSDGTWTLRVYPGTYAISTGKSEYMTSNTVSVHTNEDATALVKVKATSKLQEALSNAVNAKLDECAKSTDYAPENCPFGLYVYDEEDYRNFAWSISVYPKITDIDLNTGTFYSRQGKTKVTYEEKNYDDSWEPEDDTTTFHASGSFTIRNGKVSVTLDDGGYY